MEGWSRQRPDMQRKHWKLWLLKWFCCVSPEVATSFLLKAELSVWATRAHGDLNPGELSASASDKQWAVCCLCLIITVKNNSKPNKTLWNSFYDCTLYWLSHGMTANLAGWKIIGELFLLPQLSKHASWPNEDQIIWNAQKRLTDGWPCALKEVTTVILVVCNQKQLIIKRNLSSPTERIENTPRNALWHTYSSG